jgi:hypothetical protein
VTFYGAIKVQSARQKIHFGMDSYLKKKNNFRQDLQDFTGFYFIISSFRKKLEIFNPLPAQKP